MNWAVKFALRFHVLRLGVLRSMAIMSFRMRRQVEAPTHDLGAPLPEREVVARCVNPVQEHFLVVGVYYVGVLLV